MEYTGYVGRRHTVSYHENGKGHPVFLTLLRSNSGLLGPPLYETLNREKREITLPVVGGSKTWGGEEWPAERIIKYYGHAAWAQDRSWGYRTPVYLLNRLIRLQVVMEIVSNHTSDALKLLAFPDAGFCVSE